MSSLMRLLVWVEARNSQVSIGSMTTSISTLSQRLRNRGSACLSTYSVTMILAASEGKVRLVLNRFRLAYRLWLAEN